MTTGPATHPADALPTCPICASTRLYYVFSAGPSRVARCNDCGLLAADPSAPVHTSTDSDPTHLAVTTHDPRTATLGCIWAPDTAIEWLRRFRGRTGGSLLHVGLGNPEFIQLATGMGYEVTVVEGSEAARDRARDLLVSAGAVLWESIDRLRPATGLFDAAILDGALNNTRSPAGLLAEVHRLLKPDGVVLATAPVVDLPSHASSGTQSSVLINSGCFAFEDRTLQSMLFQNGFREIVALPSTRGRRQVREDRPCAVLARREPRRDRPLLSVVVPAFNEASTVSTTLDRVLDKRVPGVDLEVVIVESNSTDGTREIVRSYAGRERVRLVFEERPRGKGFAVRTGLAHAKGDYILIQDADMEYDLEDYDVLLEPLLAGRESFILGARHGGQTWKIRKFNDQPAQALLLNLAHGVFTSMINVSLGLALKDPFTMYKVFRRDCLHGLEFECNRFDFDWELLIKLVRKGHVPLEIPVNYRSRSFKEGKKVSIVRDPITWIIALIRSLAARIDLLPPTAADAKPN